MKPTPTLNQKLGPCEYVYSRGAATADRAEQIIENLLCEGEISLCEKPRVVAYQNSDGATRYAVALTDTALTAYV